MGAADRARATCSFLTRELSDTVICPTHDSWWQALPNLLIATDVPHRGRESASQSTSTKLFEKLVLNVKSICRASFYCDLHL